MLTMHPTLLVGPADWDPARMPKEEFLARIAALWRRAIRRRPAPSSMATARTTPSSPISPTSRPSSKPALALIPREGAPRLLVGGGVNMLPAAKPLTFVENLLPLRNAGSDDRAMDARAAAAARPC